MQNVSTCITKILGSFMTELAHTGLKCHCESCAKPQERKAIREAEIADSLLDINVNYRNDLLLG